MKRVSLLLLVALAHRAHAQSAPAEALFDEGRKLIKQGKLSAGCDKLAASDKLESSVGTLLNLGDCREKLGKLASAWAAFRKAEAIAKRAGDDRKREAEAHRRASKLEPKLASLAIEVPHRIDGLVVLRDGEQLDPAAWNVALPIDTGSCTITASAPGFIAWHKTIEITGGRLTMAIPALEREASPPEPPPPPLVAKQVVPPPAPSPTIYVPTPPTPHERVVIKAPARRGTWTKTRAVSLGFAVGGAAALATGLYFGLEARDLQSRADLRCPLAACSDPQGLQLNSDARTAARTANYAYVAGGFSLATAAVLWLVGAPVAPTLGDHQAGATFAGRF